MTVVRLHEKFFSAFEPLLSMLEITGIRVSPLTSFSLQNRSKRLVWSIFLLVLCVQSNIYMVIKRTCLLNSFFGCSKGDSDSLVRNLVHALLRWTSLLCDTTIHVTLITSIQSTITSLLALLESIDCNFNWPIVSVRIQRFSLLGLVYLLTTVSFFII